MARAVTPQLFEVRKNQIKMVLDRGYAFEPDTAENEENTLKATYSQFRRYMLDSLSQASFSDLLTKTYRRRDEDGRVRRLLVWYPEVPETSRQLGSSDASDLFLKIHELNSESESSGEDSGSDDSEERPVVPIGDVIIISKYQESSAMKLALSQQLVHYEFFMYEEMVYDPSEHMLVPPHRILPRKEAYDFLREVGETRAPQIDVSDRMCRHLGARPGQVIEISRETNRAYEADVGKGLFRRIVVKLPKV